jgi:glycosyltransferase involved in cell wall biosynthesis
LGICAPTKILAIPNGIAALPKPAVTPAEIRSQVGADEDDLVILSMARLAPDKGLEYLIEAAAILSHTERRFRIVIAGDGPERARLEEHAQNLRVADRVIFLGFREDVSDLLAACDLVVLPSLREGLSIALLEAMAAAKPIVATSIGSHRELAAQAEIARLVPPADAPALCEAILQVAWNRTQMARLRINARTLFEANYTEERMLNSYKQLYFDLLKEKCAAEGPLSSVCANQVAQRRVNP